jgi:hypothetical protein
MKEEEEEEKEEEKTRPLILFFEHWPKTKISMLIYCTCGEMVA